MRTTTHDRIALLMGSLVTALIVFTGSRVGAFTQALYDGAMKRGWNVISMKNDWKRIFAFDP